MSETVQIIIKELRRRLESLYGLRLERMVLYGSQARGDVLSNISTQGGWHRVRLAPVSQLVNVGRIMMGWIADLLKEVPSAARYKAELDKLASDCDAVKSENAALKSRLQAVEEENRNLKQRSIKIMPVTIG